MGKSKSWFDLNRDWITSGDLIWLREDLIWKIVIYFGFHLSLSWSDLWQITSLSNMRWSESNAVFGDLHWWPHPINKPSSMLKTHTEHELSAFFCHLQLVFCKTWCHVLSSSSSSKISELKESNKILIWAEIICDLGAWIEIWHKDLNLLV